MDRMRVVVALLALLALRGRAAADVADVANRVRALEAENGRLWEELRLLREDQGSVGRRLQQLAAQVSGRLTGYLDFGFFWVAGDGTGIRKDTGHEHFPEYQDVPDSWVFMGDPLSTTVNSRGEPADTGESRAVTFNPIHNHGAAAAIVNALNVAIFAGLGPDLTLNGSIDFVPRSRNVSDPGGVGLGDFIDVKLAYLEYTLPIERVDLRLSAGKFDSVLGIEYRSEESPDRIGVTPSLICRYTCGRPLGAKARLRLPRDRLTVALAVSNGSHGIEGFPFYNEIDANDFKTLAGRIATRQGLGVGVGLEIGASGAFGAQDFQADNGVYQWHYGLDLRLVLRDLDLRAEFVQGSATGKDDAAMRVPCGLAPCLSYRGAYGLLAYRLWNWLQPYARVDWRDALHRSGQSFVYISELMRATLGVRAEVGTNVIFKAEYTFNVELGRIPQFPDDIFTSSMVVKY